MELEINFENRDLLIEISFDHYDNYTNIDIDKVWEGQEELNYNDWDFIDRLEQYINHNRERYGI